VGLASWNLALRARSLDLRAELAETQRREAAARRLAERSPEPAAPGRGPDVAAPALNVPIVDLDTGGSRGASTAPIVLRIRRESPWVTFVLTVPGDPSEERHSIAIRSEDGRIVWEGGGLVANRFGTFTLAVPTSLLPAGRYRFLLSRPARDGAPRAVQTYHLVVSPPAP
jgi:hypothetical protein